MLPTLDGLNAHMRLLPNILEAADQELYMHVRQTHRSYSLSGMLTLYAHEIQEYGIIARMFDFLLATDAVMSVYLFGAVCVLFCYVLWQRLSVLSYLRVLSRHR